MQKTGKMQLLLTVVAVLVCGLFHTIQAEAFRASGPGVRGGKPGAGEPMDGLTDDEREMFDVGLVDFSEEEGVADGLGPRFNFVGCAGCHSQPAIGGTSPAVNPLFRVQGASAVHRNRLQSCHTPSLKTRSNTAVAVLGNQDVNLSSDLLLHHMGPGLADDIIQGVSEPDEFGQLPSRVSVSGSSFSTTGTRPTSLRRFEPTGVRATANSVRQRPTR